MHSSGVSYLELFQLLHRVALAFLVLFIVEVLTVVTAATDIHIVSGWCTQLTQTTTSCCSTAAMVTTGRLTGNPRDPVAVRRADRAALRGSACAHRMDGEGAVGRGAVVDAL